MGGRTKTMIFYFTTMLKQKERRNNNSTKDGVGYTFGRRNLIAIAKRMHIWIH